VWRWFRRHTAKALLAGHKHVGRRFCKVDMRGCMAHIRGEERWGTVATVEEARSDPADKRVQIVGDTRIYDGGQSEAMREHYRRLGQATYARVHYDNGTKSWEPVWWFNDTGTHLEYQT
jgi:hypothetical protein